MRKLQMLWPATILNPAVAYLKPAASLLASAKVFCNVLVSPKGQQNEGCKTRWVTTVFSEWRRAVLG